MTAPVVAAIMATADGIDIERIYTTDEMFRALTAHLTEELRPMSELF